jgi:ribonucleoside-diphosphate reductase alpha chain
LAPTGTISIIAGPCSSGIEPVFAISYFRNVMDQTKLVEVDPVFEIVAKERGFYSKELMEAIAQAGSIQHLDEIPQDVKDIFVTSHDIAPQWHVRMQAAFQKYTDNAVSKTINFPHSATEDDVKQAYLLSYELGCKGITVYRDGSRQDQVLNVSKKEAPSIDARQEVVQESRSAIEPRPRPHTMTGTTSKTMTGCGNLYVTINEDESGKPFEVFSQMGKAGGCASSQLEAIGRLISLALRSGVDPQAITAQLWGIRCPAPARDKGTRILSCADAMARVMEKRISRESQVVQMAVAATVSHEAQMSAQEKSNKANMVGVCPECGNPLMHEEGCLKCYGCGFSKC